MTTAPALTERRVRDPLQRRYAWLRQKLGHYCPRCDGLLTEDGTGPYCLEDRACGWRWSYAPGTTHRADGSAL